MKKFTLFLWLILLSVPATHAQWVPDNGDGTYKNPVIYADYSDPDVIRTDSNYYMVASSFNCMPGIPVLHSTDLVNWSIIGHVYDKLPFDKYKKPAHGEGSWAPSIRYHNGKYYVYFCTPYEGLFMSTADDPAGPWAPLTQVVNAELWEDPCPIWDGDGNAWLVHSKLCGGPLVLHKMSDDGKKLLDNGTVIFNDPENFPTTEGPKIMKKDGYYYILAPSGGVPRGWQTALRSRNIQGPYETRIVLSQNDTEINGPHQGGLVSTPGGSWWFIHFQDRDAYGRIVHLQPVEWRDDWPVMGTDPDGDYNGSPVMTWNKPDTGNYSEITIPQTSDEFDSGIPGLQWQWQANPSDSWYEYLPNKGMLRLNAVMNITNYGNPWYAPNLLLQKFPAPVFTAETSLTFYPGSTGEKAGLIVMGERYSYICLNNTKDGMKISWFEGGHEHCGEPPREEDGVPAGSNNVFLRVTVDSEANCNFYYSTDGVIYKVLGKTFKAQKGRWIGAKTGIFCINPNLYKSPGYADFDYFRINGGNNKNL